MNKSPIVKCSLELLKNPRYFKNTINAECLIFNEIGTINIEHLQYKHHIKNKCELSRLP